MYRIFVLLATIFFATHGSVIDFLQIPNDVVLQNDAKLSSSDVPVIISNLMGLTAEKPDDWTPTTSLWKRPEAAVVFVVKTPDHLKLKLQSSQVYKLTDNDLPDFSEVTSTIEDTFFDSVPTIVQTNTDIYGQHSDAIKRLRKPQKDESALSQEVSSVEAVDNWIVGHKSTIRNAVPDLFVFEIDGLIDLSLTENVGSEQMDEAVNKLKKIIKEAANNFINVYDGNVIVCVVSGSGAKIRRPRAAAKADAATSTGAPTTIVNPTTYTFYDQNYPVIFNIILWSMLALAVAILFIATSMWFMDPGRDSIIYRMTMTRAKKD